MSVASVAVLVVLAFTIEEVQLKPVTMQAFGNFDMVKGLYSVTPDVKNEGYAPEMDFKHSNYYYYKSPKGGLPIFMSGFYKDQRQVGKGLSVGTNHDLTQVWCTSYYGDIDGEVAEHGFLILLFFYNKHPQNSKDLDEGVSGAFMVHKKGPAVFIPNIPEILATPHEHIKAVPQGTTYDMDKLGNAVHVMRRRVGA